MAHMPYIGPIDLLAYCIGVYVMSCRVKIDTDISSAALYPRTFWAKLVYRPRPLRITGYTFL